LKNKKTKELIKQRDIKKREQLEVQLNEHAIQNAARKQQREQSDNARKLAEEERKRAGAKRNLLPKIERNSTAPPRHLQRIAENPS